MSRYLHALGTLYRSTRTIIDDTAALKPFRVRGLELGDWTVWAVLATGLMHLSGAVVGHELHDQLKRLVTRLMHREKGASDEVQEILSRVIEHPLLAVSRVSDKDRSEAIGAITKVLTSAGHPTDIASQKAQAVVRKLITELPPSPKIGL